MKRFDFLFSYWIFIWYILYKLKLVNYSPNIALIIALFINVLQFLVMIWFSYSTINIFLFVFSILLLKGLPFWTLCNDEYRWIDFYVFIGLFVAYNVWLGLNGTHIQKEFSEVYININKNKPIGPLMYHVHNFFSK